MAEKRKPVNIVKQIRKATAKRFSAEDKIRIVLEGMRGEITISELCHVGKPAILIPSPNVAEDHQTRNANSLVDQGAAICLPDHEAVSGMMAAAIELLGNDTKQAALSKNIKALAFPDSGGRIAEEIISLMNDES